VIITSSCGFAFFDDIDSFVAKTPYPAVLIIFIYLALLTI